MSKVRPCVFIGSSAEGLDVAKAIQLELQYSGECVIWSQGVFGLMEGSLNSLVKALDKYDFAILVLTPDDLVSSRGESSQAPRDNVLLELGMFLGALGRSRTFMVVDRKANLKLPTDLAGITPASFQMPESGTMQSAVGPACTQIESVIKSEGPKKSGDTIHISGFASYNPTRGIGFNVTNHGEAPFPPYNMCLFHPKLGSNFMFETDHSGELLPNQVRSHVCAVQKSDSHDYWYPRLSPDHDNTSPLPPEEELGFSLHLVLEQSVKVLFENHRIALGFVNLVRGAEVAGKLEGSWEDWKELDSSLPDE